MNRREQNEPGARKTWRVGTLTYTAAGLAMLFVWLLVGDFAWQIKERSVGATAQLVLRQLGAADVLVGLLIGSVPAALGMIIGPVVSVRSDRFRSRWGRRIPFLLVPVPLVVLSMVGLALTPSVGALFHQWLGDRSPGPSGCALMAFSGFWMVFELAGIITNALFGALINDVVPHQVIGRFFGLFRIVSLIDGILFNTFIIGHAEQHFFWIFIITGLIYGVGFTLMGLMVKEGEYPPPAELEKTPSGRFQALATYLRECYTTPFYLWVFLAYILCALSFGPVNSFSIFFAKSLDIGIDVYGKFIAASYVVSLVLAYPMGIFADRFHPVRMAIGCMTLYVAIALWGALYARDLTSFGIAFVGHTIISGAYLTATASISQRLFPKLKFAQFASAMGILHAIGGAILPPLVGLFLDLNGHLYRMTFLFSGLLALGGLAAFIMVHRGLMKLGGPAHFVPPLSQSAEPT